MAASKNDEVHALDLDDSTNDTASDADAHKSSDDIVLISKEGLHFTLPRSVAAMSDYIRSCIELDKTVTEVPLKYIEGDTLKKIVEWMNYHSTTPSRAIPRPLKSSNLTEIVGVWDASYVDVDLELVFKVLLAANYLHLTPLLELCCSKVASLMLGKTPKQIRTIFNVRDDFTPEEEQEIRQEFAEFL